MPLYPPAVVPSSLSGERLDRALAELFPEVSRRAARGHIVNGSVFVDGRRVRTQSRPLRGGERIELRAPAATKAPNPRDMPFEGAWREEGSLIVAEKPSGVFTEPTRQASAGTLAHELRQRLQATRKRPVPYLAAVHRLDRETSGVLLLADDPALVARLSHCFATGAVERVYLALVEGSLPFEARVLTTPIERQRRADGRYHLGPSGRPAVTEVKVIVRGQGSALVEVRPRTGRPHQLRAHLAAEGGPVAGDVRYGAAATDHGAFGLHALRLDVVLDGVPRRFTAPLPAAFLALAEAQGLPRDEVIASARALLDEETT
ncbi:MAG: RluA family pseudouridine synthase [Myxococcota bacterium]